MLVATACSVATHQQARPLATPPSPTSSVAGSRIVHFPGPHRTAPRRASSLTKQIQTTEPKLDDAITSWLTGGGGSRSDRGRAVKLGGLWQQKLMRRLVEKPSTARKVIARLPRRIARWVGARVEAGAGLRSLTTPISGRIHLPTNPPSPYDDLLRLYRRAEKRFGIPAEILAAVNFVESKFGRILGPSSAGAEGPMQFLPSTWAIYGHGDINDPHDSIMAAARYLRHSGAPRNMHGALLAYNNADQYADAVLIYASEMARRPNSFYSYYFWQVFVRTTRGDVQLTGPGSS